MDDPIARIECLAAAALPPQRTEHYDGWLLSAAAGYTNRANSVSVSGPSTLDLDVKLAHCRRFYAPRGVVFRLTPAAADLDAALERRGWRRDDEVAVSARPLDDPPHADPNVAGSEAGPWLERLADLRPRVAAHRATVAEMLNRVAGESVYVSIGDAAVGRSVLAEGHLGIFDINVAPDRRRTGLGRAITATLLAGGAARGAHTAYLQVATANTAGRALFGGFGFVERYRYWYRRQPDQR